MYTHLARQQQGPRTTDYRGFAASYATINYADAHQAPSMKGAELDGS